MGFVNRFLAMAFVCLVLTSLVVISVKSVEVYAVDKPFVPQFTVKLVDNSYDVPPSTTTTTNPYTGEKTTTTIPGYHVENKAIEVTIKNQPNPSGTAENGRDYELWYSVQAKGHFSEDWYPWGDNYSSDSQYTTYSLPANYATGDKIDFRVEAIIGHLYDPFPDSLWNPLEYMTDASSGWSKVQTFTMPSDSASVSPSQTATQPTNPSATSDNSQPHQSEQSQLSDFVFHPLFLLGVGALVGGVVVATVVLVFTRR